MHPEAFARLHARCFTDTPRPWRAEEFAAILIDPRHVPVVEPDGFAIGRIAGPEAELLTLAVDPAARRQGIARRLLTDLETRLARAGAEEIFLEVAVSNLPARALYAAAGFAEVGRRPGYYVRQDAPAVDALVLRKRPGNGRP